MRPGQTVVTYDQAWRTYRLEYWGEITIRYELELTHPDNAAGRLAIREAESGRYPVAGAGLYYRRRDGGLIEPRFFARVGAVDSLAHELVPGGVRLTIHETLEGVPHTKRYTITLVGRSLAIQAESLDGRRAARGAYVGFTAGDIEGTVDGVNVRLPYMDAVPVTMLDHRWFVSTLLDYPESSAGELLPRGPLALPGGFANEVGTLLVPDTEGQVVPVRERVWVTVSPEVSDVFAVPQTGPSPHRSDLLSSVHVTVVSGAPAVDFAAQASYLARLRELGVEDVVVHHRRWRDPASLLPAQGPPDPAAGGAEAFREVARQAPGILAPSGALTVTEQPCPTERNLLYRAQDRVVDSEGHPKRLAGEAGERDCGGGLTVGRFLLPPDAARILVPGESATLAALGAQGITLSAPAWNPGYPYPGAESNILDRQARASHSSTLGQAVSAYRRLFARLQDQLGPVFAEGARGLWEVGFDSFYAGYVDGVARSLSTGSLEVPGAGYLVVPDYELTVVRPRMVNYGMGDYQSFFGRSLSGGALALSEAEIDEWRATTLAYGHAGAWETTARSATGSSFLTLAEELKTYYLLRPLQRRYLDAPLGAVGYVGADGRERDLSAALREDMPLATPQLHLSYAGGLELWVNHSPNLWPVTVAAETILLPTHGWAVRGADGLWGYSALVEGRLVDFLTAAEWTVLDGRGDMVAIEGWQARELKVFFPDGRVLEEQPDGSVRLIGP